MKKVVLAYILLLFCVCPFYGQERNLNRIPKNKRDKILTEIANQVLIKYGPGYYREDAVPVIDPRRMSKEDSVNGDTDAGRKYYSVIFYYDHSKLRLSLDYMAAVLIWADNGKAFRVFFGSGAGLVDIDKREPDVQVPYKEIIMEVFDWESFNDSIFKVIEMEAQRDSIMNLNK